MKQQHFDRIGSSEYIDFPDAGIYSVPAKIDTGADSCAVWASNISEKNGQLTFSLFGAGSAFYTGQLIKTDEYKTTPIKNSFGEKELRYVVKLRLKIGEKVLSVRFTLADRSRNHFPILLGKNMLRNRFLVDVSANYLLSPLDDLIKHNHFTVLTSRVDDASKHFFDKVRSEVSGSEIDLVHYDDLAFWFDGQPRVTVLSSGKDLSESKVIYFKNYKKYPEHAAAAALYARYKNVVFHDEEIGRAISSSKLSEMMKLSCYGLPVPEGVAMSTEAFVRHADQVITAFGLPLVLKDVFSDRGKNNYYIDSKKAFLSHLKKSPKECFFVAQKFIPNDGFSRIFVFGKDAVMQVDRVKYESKKPERRHLNKPFGGKNATLKEASLISSNLAALSVKASEVLQRQIAGVDLIQDKETKEWYILEVNYNPEMVGSSYESEKAVVFAKYVAKEMERW